MRSLPRGRRITAARRRSQRFWWFQSGQQLPSALASRRWLLATRPRRRSSATPDGDSFAALRAALAQATRRWLLAIRRGGTSYEGHTVFKMAARCSKG
ncbi:hypothetical protein M6B38_410970 [Iris pallida]|uniref:Uncharacterized protein n=1 Tax=Iris pallida TaxID=29817 RepID=A0AAX6FME7_IRIPA|nr:hypothetical protein M6B38_410970 [Iris pallida]